MRVVTLACASVLSLGELAEHWRRGSPEHTWTERFVDP